MENIPADKPFYKGRFFQFACILGLLYILGNYVLKEEPVYKVMERKETYVAVFDVKPNIGYDKDAKEWFWGATFQTTSVPAWTELKCKVTALAADRKTELASYEYPHNVLKDGTVIPYGDFAILPSAEKSLVKSIKTFKVECKKWSG